MVCCWIQRIVRMSFSDSWIPKLDLLHTENERRTRTFTVCACIQYVQHGVVRRLHAAGQSRNLMLHFSRVEMWRVEMCRVASLMRLWHVRSYYLTIYPAAAFLHPHLPGTIKGNTTEPHMPSWLWLPPSTSHRPSCKSSSKKSMSNWPVALLF